jgi:hypothetical protein
LDGHAQLIWQIDEFQAGGQTSKRLAEAEVKTAPPGGDKRRLICWVLPERISDCHVMV